MNARVPASEERRQGREQPGRFEALVERLKKMRPETAALEMWTGGEKLFWGLRDHGQERSFPAAHLSWGDRQLVGLLAVLYHARPGSVLAIEEVDRGFHHSRYLEVLEFLSEAAYDGLDGALPLQIILTTHSPSFLNQLEDRLAEVRLVDRQSSGTTRVRPLEDLAQENLNTTTPSASLGELWEMGLLEPVAPEE